VTQPHRPRDRDDGEHGVAAGLIPLAVVHQVQRLQLKDEKVV